MLLSIKPVAQPVTQTRVIPIKIFITTWLHWGLVMVDILSRSGSMRRVTLSDVADLAKVSKATVSHVINNTRFVEEGTRNRVLAAVKELGYQPSLVARSLATNRTETIGIIVSDVTNNFFGDVLSGIEDYCRPYNYRLLVCNTAETLEREDQFIEMLLRQRVYGIIDAAASQKWDIIKRADIEHTPLVFADRAYDGLSGPYVGVKN